MGNKIAEWADKHNLLPSLVDSLIRDLGKCINLIFINCSTNSRVKCSLDTRLDYYTVVTTLLEFIRFTPGAGKKYLPFKKYKDFR